MVKQLCLLACVVLKPYIGGSAILIYFFKWVKICFYYKNLIYHLVINVLTEHDFGTKTLQQALKSTIFSKS